jgi:hypothetical protein
MIPCVHDHAAPPGPPRFEAGSTVVRRDTLDGRIWTAYPYRVLADSGDELVLACWPGIEVLAPTTWTEWLRTGDAGVRMRGIANLAARRWELAPWTWRDTSVRSRFGVGDYWSVHQFTGPAPGEAHWYVNFERPGRRTSIGFDSFDLLVDLIVDPESLTWQWKDEDEYQHGRRLGLISDATHAQVDEARQAVLALVQARQGPFASEWTDWRPDPGWPLPALPPDALIVPARF